LNCLKLFHYISHIFLIYIYTGSVLVVEVKMGSFTSKIRCIGRGSTGHGSASTTNKSGNGSMANILPKNDEISSVFPSVTR
jgi:hypothetical protein